MSLGVKGRAEHVATRYFALAIIALVLLLNYADRLILAMLVEPIRTEFRLTDSQIGLLTGPAFALVYAVFVIPIARFAETHSRVIIVTIGLVVWSAATAACGLAGSFATLMLARVLVGSGEAAGLAPSMSMVSDLFPAQQRATAMALFGLGGSVAIVLTPLVGGALLTSVGWRWTLVSLGGAGALSALLLVLGVREPQRGGQDRASMAPLHPWRSSIAALLARRAYVLLIVANVAITLAQSAVLYWLPTFFERSYGLKAAALGVSLSLYQGVPLIAGNLLSGVLGDYFIRRDQRWMVWLPMLTALATAPILAGLFAVHNVSFGLALLAIPSFLQGLSVGPTYAVLQNLAPVRSRTTATAVLAFCITIIGISLGPLILGTLSQFLSARVGADGLRLAFFFVCPLYAVAAAVYFFMSRSLIRDLADVGYMIAVDQVTDP